MLMYDSCMLKYLGNYPVVSTQDTSWLHYELDEIFLLPLPMYPPSLSILDLGLGLQTKLLGGK